ncbi:flagellar hook-basal body complex protein FliE [Paragemmobacter ruber]|uniref:Flagellar hook-basal body complex protein FliE n=1 Tax=Paragemmobacter ruber TaxID=1985673 RepID=A0ABW9Y6E3_9RHOB|nr:flagellar hook-basal body complex protein FliE [Rhodobacter ruber]NBE07385.1 flagellar hook-basal body complex protein FliE [Rhodobacter ruber]
MTIFASIAPDLYLRDRAALRPEPADPSLSSHAADFAAEFAATLNRNEATARAAMTGEASIHQLVEALTSTQSAVETVAAVRDRVVEAYQEILRMPV